MFDIIDDNFIFISCLFKYKKALSLHVFEYLIAKTCPWA